MVEITDLMKQRAPMASVDIHNNSGRNPHYSGINSLQPEFLNLASLFSDTMIYFTSPAGIQSAAFAEFCIKPKLKKGKTLLFADLRFRQQQLFNEANTVFDPKELYAGYSSQFVDVLLGNQIVTWGRTDGFNPTNTITPTDYFFLSPIPDDQKLSNFMLRAQLRFTPEIELDLIGIPFYKQSVYRYNLFVTDENVSFASPWLPEKDIENGTLAARLNFEFPVAGFSISASSGYNPYQGYDVLSVEFSATQPPQITNIAKPYKNNTLGADFAVPLGAVIIRGEAAYNHTTNFADSISVPNPDFGYVTGIEANIAGVTAIFQYIGKYTMDFETLVEPELTDPMNPLAQMAYAEEMILYASEKFSRKVFYQQKETNHAVVLSLNRDFMYSAINAELTGYYNFTSESFLVRPMLAWKVDDSLTAKIGGSYMYGSKDSMFEKTAPILNGLIVSVKANF